MSYITFTRQLPSLWHQSSLIPTQWEMRPEGPFLKPETVVQLQSADTRAGPPAGTAVPTFPSHLPSLYH